MPRSPKVKVEDRRPVGFPISARSGCRDASGNRLVGRVPPSLLAMQSPHGRLYNSLYDSRCRHRLASAVELQMPSSRVCGGGSLFRQEGCPLQRYGRVGQDRDANDFGVCVAGPACPTPNENILLVPHVSAQNTPCARGSHQGSQSTPSGYYEYPMRVLTVP
jgi:hypothetical protein